jgi:TonB family protein
LRLSKNATLRPGSRARWALAFIVMLILACSSVSADNPGATFGLSSSQGAQDPSSARQAVIPTHAGLQLTVRGGCANVRILTDASDSVSYAARPDPRVAGASPRYSQDFPLTAHNTPRGVVLIGPAGRERDCGNVTYEIHVPRRYDLDVVVLSGDIVTQDIDGVVALSTGGGEIRAGSIGSSEGAPKTSANVAFVARLGTAGGDIRVGNAAGGLRAATAGGQISAGDVHGPAVLRTGGGDIHIGHVFGEAHFTTGGGDIVVQKVDGAVWVDTAGGRVEIGDAARLATAAPQVLAGESDAFPTAELGHGSEGQESTPAISDLTDFTEVARLFDLFLRGGIRVGSADQQKRLISSIAPEYPDVARLAGIEGDVTLRIFVGRDGTVRNITSVSGSPVLARAAIHAVERWRYAPALLQGHPVDVVTTVSLAFRLHP